MALEKLSKSLSDNPRYKHLQKPLEAAEICEAARKLARGRYEIISFKNGTLALSVSSPAAAANLQAESVKIIEDINKKLGEEKLKRIRFKISNYSN